MGNIIREYYNKTLNAYKTGGIGLILMRGIKKALTTNSAIWFERDLSLPIKEINTKIPIEAVQFSNEGSLEWLKHNDRRWMIEPVEIKLGLEQGHYFPNIKYKGEIISCLKVGFGEVYITDYKKSVFFPAKMAFHTDIYVIPEYRGMGVASFLLTETLKFLKKNGFTKIRCHIPVWNKASMSVHFKAGFKKIGYIRYFRVFGFGILTGDPVRLNDSQ